MHASELSREDDGDRVTRLANPHGVRACEFDCDGASREKKKKKQMADKEKQSAEEIVDNMAEEMGVKDKKVPGDSAEDLASDLGGIFGVSSKKKKKKKKVEPEVVVVEEEVQDPIEEEVSEPAEVAADEPSDVDEEEEVVVVKPAPEAKKKAAPSTVKKSEPAAPKKKNKAAAIDGVFATGRSNDVAVSNSSSNYLDEDDLDGISPSGGSNTGLIAVIVVLVVALLGVVLFVTPIGNDLVLVMKGEYRERKDAEIARQEEAYMKAQKEKLPKYGNLTVTGSPLYATIKLNGDVQYGQTSSGIWREVLLKPGISNFGNLRAKEKQVIEVTSPGFTPATFELTESRWEGEDEGPKMFNYVATLKPESEWTQMEFDARMGSDTDNEFFGTVVINSAPAGASIKFNNKELLDKDGNPLKTPATFSSAYFKDEAGKLQEAAVRVDTTLDLGHKIEVFFDGQPDMPRYGTQLERQMWTCTKKGEDAIKKLPKDHTVQHECDYTYTKTVDFNGLQAYIKGREEERKRIEEYNAQIKEMREKQLKGELELSPAETSALEQK